MSYEGYEQYLCKNGHYFTKDCAYSWGSLKEELCPDCQEKAVWCNSVDETNCDGVGYVPMSRLLIKGAEHKTCDLGHAHQVSPTVYRIPTPKETPDLRTWRDNDEKG